MGMFSDEISASNLWINSGNLSWKTLEFPDKIGPISSLNIPNFSKKIIQFLRVIVQNARKMVQSFAKDCPNLFRRFIKETYWTIFRKYRAISRRNWIIFLKISGNLERKLDRFSEEYPEFFGQKWRKNYHWCFFPCLRRSCLV